MRTLSQVGGNRQPTFSLPNPPYDPLKGASAVKWYKRWDPIRKRWVVALVSYTNRIGVNDRYRRMYDTNSLNIRCDVLDEAESDGVEIIVIRITYKSLGKTVYYLAPVSTIREFGTREYLYDCWQWSLPLCYWSTDGAEPVGPEPVQPGLFEMEGIA